MAASKESQVTAVRSRAAHSHKLPTLLTEEFVRLSKDPDAGVRVSAAVALGKACMADAEGPLKELLNDGDISVGIAAAESLSKLNNYALITCTAQLKNNCWELRHRAATMLAHIGTAKQVPTLIGVLQDGMWKVRVSAALALGKIGNLDAIPSLRTCLQEDDDIYVKVAAAKALRCFEIFDGVPVLMESLRHSSEEVRREAVGAIGQIGRPEDLPVLKLALGDQHHEVRAVAAKALAKLGHLDGVSVLMADLGHNGYTARRDAAEALGAIGSSDAVPALLEGLHDRHRAVRRECAVALGAIGDASVRSLLEKCSLEEEDFQVRAAIKAVLLAMKQNRCSRVQAH